MEGVVTPQHREQWWRQAHLHVQVSAQHQHRAVTGRGAYVRMKDGSLRLQPLLRAAKEARKTRRQRRALRHERRLQLAAQAQRAKRDERDAAR